MSADPWLQRWLPLVRERTSDLPVTELGCGSGTDTAVLVESGHRVIAIDVSSAAIAQARAAVPEAEYHCQDLRAPFPSSAANVAIVIASLSIHYFPWLETRALVERIRATLRLGDALICRLNSTNDHNFTEPSSLPESNRLPSFDTASERTGFDCTGKARSLNV